MLEYNFAKIITEYIPLYKELLIPTVICDESFTVHWSNSAARTAYPEATAAEGISRLLKEFDCDDLLSRMKRDGTCLIEGAFGLGNIHLNLMPIIRDGEVAGAVVFIVAPQSVISPRDIVVSSQTPAMLEKSVRRIVQNFFGVMDSASYTADLLDAGWVKPSLSEISHNSYELLRIVTNISHYTQYQAVPPMLSIKAAGLFDLLRESEKPVKGIASGMGVPVNFELPEEAGVAGIDTDKFLLAFFNILHNSLYFTKPGNSIDITGSSDRKGFAVIVSDRGTGIAADVLPHIFRPYFSAGHDFKPAGIGLGLTVAKTIIEAHNGTLEINSRENEGTTAVFTIPKSAFSKHALFRQDRSIFGTDRFSRVYVGLSDAAESPYRDS